MKNITLTNGLLSVMLLIMGSMAPKMFTMETNIAVIQEKLTTSTISRLEYQDLLTRVTKLEAKSEFQYGNKSGQYTSYASKLWNESFPTVSFYKAQPVN